ncbi:hypothetical protein OKW21_001858 [Catalinimonas alkaloidigena]|nr:hypothetical protein [Catalinimonas alkaloidigena]
MEEIKLKLSRFCHQSESYRTKYTWLHGNLLLSKIESNYSYHLYTVDGFFVELVFNKKSQSIESINPTIKYAKLNRYLGQISLKNLLN